jgi:hypothetical protein
MLVIILHHSEVVTLCVCGILHKGFPRKKIISFGLYFEKKNSLYIQKVLDTVTVVEPVATTLSRVEVLQEVIPPCTPEAYVS